MMCLVATPMGFDVLAAMMNSSVEGRQAASHVMPKSSFPVMLLQGPKDRLVKYRSRSAHHLRTKTFIATCRVTYSQYR